MKRKSKFLTFILSFIPGLGHIYLGLMQRGLVYLLATVFVIIGGMFCMTLHIFYEPIPLVLLPFIWLVALVDALILVDKVNRGIAAAEAAGTAGSAAAGAGEGLSWQSSVVNEEEFKRQNQKILAVIFSMIPGAGHMYLGKMAKGIQLMVAFFLALYLSDFLNLSLLLMFAPILWFYSVFDILQKVAHPEKCQEEAVIEGLFREADFSGKAGKYLGIGLIVIGVIMILGKIVLPQLEIWFDERFIEYLRTGIIALIFIAGGIRLVMGGKEKSKDKGEKQA